MKKFFKWIIKNKSKLLLIFFFTIIISSVISCNIYAMTTPSEKSELENNISGIVNGILTLAGGVLMTPISALVKAFAIILFVILYSVFRPVSDGLAFPFPDQIVFNQIPFFDPNFINPTPSSVSGASLVLVDRLQMLIQNMYYSFFVLAGSIFVIAAIIIGIKLAITSIAAERAQYKESIKVWVTGIILLFTIHFILAGMFYLNEQIVKGAKEFVGDVPIHLNAFDFGGSIGHSIGNLLNGIVGIFTGEEQPNIGEFTVNGYGGVIMLFLQKGLLADDIIYTIGLCIMLGQTFSLIIHYIKRMFYCIMLGMIAPIIVAVDTVQRAVTGKNSEGIFRNWFRTMFSLIFTQSFQAIMMIFILKIVSLISVDTAKLDWENDFNGLSMALGLIAIIGIMAILKFEKLFKEMFGFKDSKLLGGISDSAAKSFAAIKSGVSMAQRTMAPNKNKRDAINKINAAAKKKRNALEGLNSLKNDNNLNSQGNTNTVSNRINNNNNGTLSNVGNTPEESSLREELNLLRNEISKNTAAIQNGVGVSGDTEKDIEKQRKKYNEQLREAEEEMRMAMADKSAASLRKFTRFGSTIAAVGFGLGASDNIGDATTIANITDIPMDAMSDRYVNRRVYGGVGKQLEREIKEKRKKLTDELSKTTGLSVDSKKLQSMVEVQLQPLKNVKIDIDANIPKSVLKSAMEDFQSISDATIKGTSKYARKQAKKLYESSNIDNI